MAYDGGAIAGWGLSVEWRGTFLLLRNPTRLANGAFQVEVSGQTGIPTIIQRSADLRTWAPVATNVFSTDPGIFTDPAPPPGYRFYRALQP